MNRFSFSDATLDWCINCLHELSPSFQSSQSSDVLPVEGPIYNLMADAIEWPDERPNALLSSGKLKQLYTALLNARTNIILKEDPNGNSQRLLDVAATIIPNWNGLLLERRNPLLETIFRKLQTSAMSRVERDLDCS